MRVHTLITLLVLLLSVCYVYCDHCHGVVGISEDLKKFGNVNIDFTAAEVHLVNRQGYVKETVQPMPNGYWLLPIYDKGDFIIRVSGPKGWSFEPSEVPVSVSGDLSCPTEINFYFNGFSIEGKVVSLGMEQETDKGPKGVEVTLYDTADQKLQVVKTKKGGSYVFNKIAPGRYTVKTAAGGNVAAANAEATVEVVASSIAVPKHLVVSGYDVSGRVVFESSGVADVAFHLYTAKQSAEAAAANNVACAAPSTPGPLDGRRSLCETHSDVNGAFSFKSVPVGDYIIVPLYKGFRITPSQIAVSVVDGSVALSTPFKLAGFTVKGAVQDVKGRPVARATIYVNGKRLVVSEQNGKKRYLRTNKNGEFQLSDIVAGVYDISARKRLMSFSKLTRLQIAPKTMQLPAIVVTKYAVCGHVLLHPAIESLPTVSKSRSIELKAVDSVYSQVKTTGANGRFCFKAPVRAGGVTYRITPQISAAEKSAGLVVLSPEYSEVTVVDGPITDITFSQSLVSVSGRVKCVSGACDSTVTVTLTSKTRKFSTSTHIDLKSENKNTFKFSNILPDSYRVSVEHQSWCWEKDTQDIKVGTSDVTDVELVQKGFEITCVASHNDVKLNIEHATSKYSLTHTLVKGSNKICVTQSGVYRITPESCFRFEDDVYQYDTSDPRVLDFDATSYQVVGTIRTAPPTGAASDAPADIVVHIRETASNPSVLPSRGSTSLVSSNDNNNANTIVPATLVSREGNAHVYEYKYWATLGQQIEITPKCSSLLFYPQHRSLTISSSNDCPPPVQPFTARPGLMFSGSVTPAVSGVKVSALQQPNKEVVLTVETDATGSYSIGPLYDDKTYSIEAEREGYYVKRVSDFDFQVMQLSSVTVNLVDESSNEPLVGVLVSLTGGAAAQYRNNSVTPASGVLRFARLFPGAYFMRPLLKEYQFAQNTYTIDLEAGKDVEITVKGKRVAFSCFGSVFSLNGQPEQSITIEAIADGQYEEAVSDANGSYRLRGLLPNKKYTVRVKRALNGPIDHASPDVDVTPSRADIVDVNFVVFHANNKMYDISGTVNTTAELARTLEVELLVGSRIEDARVVKTVPLTVSRFFEFASVSLESGNAYYLRLSSSLSRRTHQYDTPIVPVTLHPPHRSVHVHLNFDAKMIPVSQEIARAPFFALLTAFALVVAYVYRKQLQNFINSTPASQKPALKKRKQA